ncbi:hypothetical protein [Lysinibacillus piscis]|uniref:Uncharacterized protein n=1 Tax=Lysinibacillus piscis TaxID=2518931 RepID=A0ABQ5NKB3_9BACI|nr:hypothetical protein [Lysinibacillus sp. KH24]GLC88715.1 hypothetical protein LYSBPC_18420 [Lysinibacillus sp. KH24]
MKHRPPIAYHSAGKDIIETDDERFFALNGWDGERYMNCYECTYFGQKISQTVYVVRPVWGNAVLGITDEEDFILDYVVEE